VGFCLVFGGRRKLLVDAWFCVDDFFIDKGIGCIFVGTCVEKEQTPV
jgi:hypothetical protein